MQLHYQTRNAAHLQLVELRGLLDLEKDLGSISGDDLDVQRVVCTWSADLLRAFRASSRCTRARDCGEERTIGLRLGLGRWLVVLGRSGVRHFGFVYWNVCEAKVAAIYRML
jgi:hypothetical protein